MLGCTHDMNLVLLSVFACTSFAFAELGSSTVSSCLLQSTKSRSGNISLPMLPDLCGILAFIHIPKNGGTAVQSSARNHGYEWNLRFDANFTLSQVPVGSCMYSEAPASAFTDAGIMPSPHQAVVQAGGEFFCVKRDPYSRVVSEFRYRKGQQLGMHSIPSFLNAELLRKRVGPYPCSPEGLSNFVLDDLDNFSSTPSRSHAYDGSCHMLPQSSYIWEGNITWCKHIIALEDFPKSFNNLMAESGCEVRLDSPKTNDAEACEGLTTEDLTPAAKQRIREAYKEDFVNLGYRM